MKNHNENQSITIVTAFFDIGRGNLQSKEEFPSYLTRTNDTYFEYFTKLATLDNPMVVFTSYEHIERVKNIRGTKPTTIIPFDINKFRKTLDSIKNIQKSESFTSKINPEVIKNLEYWLPEYVLINNLKPYFLYKAIKSKLVKTELVAWVDFGYVRNDETLNNIKEWQYNFELNKVNFFTIRKNYKIKSKEDVYHAMFNNIIYVIGSVIVSSREQWKIFFKDILSTQKRLLRTQIVDDDQGVYLMCIFNKKDNYKLNYLGKDNWFHIFRKYDKTSKISLKEKIKDIFI